jgi:transposase-like protein
VHQIRNLLKYVASKDQEPFMVDQKPVYQDISLNNAEQQLQALEAKWRQKFRVLVDSWHRN